MRKQSSKRKLYLEELEKMSPSEVDLLLKNRNVQKISNHIFNIQKVIMPISQIYRCNENETMSDEERTHGNFF